MPVLASTKAAFSKAAWGAYNRWRLGFGFRRELAELTARLNGSREAILDFQWRRLTKLLRHAYLTTPYYRTLFDAIKLHPDDIRTPQDLRHLPTLEKSTLQTRLDDLKSTAIPVSKMKRNATGGSSGTPVVFYQDRDYWNRRNLSVYYFDRWAGWDFGERQLIIWGAQVDVSNARRLTNRVNNLWRNHWWLDGFDLSESVMADAARRMGRWRPQTVLAYASSLHLFSCYLEEHGLDARGWGVKGIISTAEMLHPHYRKAAENAFGAKVYNRYGSREVGLIAMECSAGGLHLNCNDLFVEVDSPDPYTEPGDILVTQLNNDAMPFIRYRIGDVGVLSDRVCPCGNQLPVLKDLLGRTTATFRTREGKLIHGGYFTQQFYRIQSVKQFQLIQESYDRCTLKLVVRTEFKATDAEPLVVKIQEALGKQVDVQIEIVPSIPKPPSGKMAFTISRVNGG